MSNYPFPLPEPIHGVAYPKSLDELDALRVFHGKFLRPQMLGIHSQNPFAPWNSPSRSVMTTQHLPQRLIVEGLKSPTILTGLEYELAKYTIAERMPENGTVIAVVPRYPARAGANNRIGFSPETTVIVEYFVEPEGDEPGYMTLDAIPIKQYTSLHQHFGFRNKPHEQLSTKLNPKERIPKGFAFTNTPAVQDDGCYATGIEPMVCFLDVPGTAEDSIIVRRGYLPQMAFTVFEEIDIGFGGSDVPVNLHGDNENFKIFPDIGERIPKSGLLMAVRPVTERLGVATLGQDDLRKMDRIFDNKRYSREACTDANGFMTTEPGRVIDIQVIKNTENPRLPPSMAGQLEDYVTALRMYYTRLLEIETRMILENKRQGGTGELKMAPRMTNLLVRARALTGHGSNRFNSSLVLQEHKAVLDEYTVRFTIEHRIIPTKGQKATCFSGGINRLAGFCQSNNA